MAQSNGFDSPLNGSNGASSKTGGHRPGYTGRYIISFEPGSSAQAILQNKAGVEAFSALELGVEAAGSQNTVFEEIGVAVVSALPEQHVALMAAMADASTPVSRVEPERIVWASMYEGIDPAPSLDANGARRLASAPSPFAAPQAFGAPAQLAPAAGAFSAEFLRGYLAAIQGLAAGTVPALAEAGLGAMIDVRGLSATWGLLATKVLESTRSGQGIRVAVLDTGFDLAHPDFAGRTVVSRSFVSGESVQDGHGHGTHCIGTSCGPRSAGSNPRYGIAFGAEIYVGKVLSNAGSGADGGILAGINWAVQNRCAVVSMSLGSPVAPGETFSQVYQDAALAAERKGTLIVCAAGNESHRPGDIQPVGHPANCPTILAVGALDSALEVAFFSCGGLNPNGGEVNLTGPGVGVFSSWPMPRRYNTISGTSMATPHVAGIAALYAEATGLRGLALANEMLRHSRRLSPIADFGWGLVQAI